MFQTIRRWLTPPVFETEATNRRVRFLHAILLYSMASTFITGVVLSVWLVDAASIGLRVVVFGALFVTIIAYVLLRLRQVWLAEAAFLLLIFNGTVAITALSEGLLNSASVGYGVFILAAGLLLGVANAYGAALASAVAVAVIYGLDATGLYEFPAQADPVLANLAVMFTFLIAGVVVLLAATTFEDQALKDLRQTNLKLQQAQQQLANRVSARARNLQRAFEINRQFTKFLNIEKLSDVVVSQLQSTFGYYHVHLYLLNPTTQSLRLAAATGEAGQQLLARKHRLEADSGGMVRQAAESGQPVLANDVTTVSDWLPTPLIPNTRAQLAVPIITPSGVLAIIDVQNQKEDTFSEDDIEVLQAIAAQIAVVLTNANRYEQLQRQAQYQALTNQAVTQVQQATDLQSTLAHAAHAITAATSAQRGVVAIGIEHLTDEPRASAAKVNP